MRSERRSKKMNPAGFSVRRPVTITMMVLAVVLIGIVSFIRLKMLH